MQNYCVAQKWAKRKRNRNATKDNSHTIPNGICDLLRLAALA